mmetsp:Transcript_10385/g.16980  ORF Transcript_10385/g.16980 Transcript_10385/m.16980 type:complete len:205 (-) Transcript_10385:1797-2411(-)
MMNRSLFKCFFQVLDRFLKIFLVPSVLVLHLRVDAWTDILHRTIQLHYLFHCLDQQVRGLNMHNCRLHITPTRLDGIFQRLRLHAFCLGIFLLCIDFFAKLADQSVKCGVALVVSLQLVVHIFDLLPHRHNLHLTWLNLLFELSNFEVQDKFKLVQLLVLLLQFVDALFLLTNRNITSLDFLLMGGHLLLQDFNFIVQLLLFYQ